MALHRDVRVEMIESTIGFFAALPSAFVHSLNLFIATSGSLDLLRTGNRDERVDLSGSYPPSQQMALVAQTSSHSFRLDRILPEDWDDRPYAEGLAPAWHNADGSGPAAGIEDRTELEAIPAEGDRE